MANPKQEAVHTVIYTIYFISKLHFTISYITISIYKYSSEYSQNLFIKCIELASIAVHKVYTVLLSKIKP